MRICMKLGWYNEYFNGGYDFFRYLWYTAWSVISITDNVRSSLFQPAYLIFIPVISCIGNAKVDPSVAECTPCHIIRRSFDVSCPITGLSSRRVDRQKSDINFRASRLREEYAAISQDPETMTSLTDELCSHYCPVILSNNRSFLVSQPNYAANLGKPPYCSQH